MFHAVVRRLQDNPKNKKGRMAHQNLEPQGVSNQPSVTFKTVTFSDGKTLTLDEADVVVFVGPNNAGKSRALKELEDHVSNTPETLVIKSVELRKTGTPEGFLEFLKRHTEIRVQGQLCITEGPGFGLNTSSGLETLWQGDISWCRPLFCVRIQTVTRIQDSNQQNAIDTNNAHPTHPIHRLYADDQLELRISNYFERAFGEALIVDQRSGSQVPLRVGTRLAPEPGEDRLSSTYWTRLRNSSVLLDQQGDGMRSFASVILHLLAPITPSILLLDEPEAFLHPPQARLLGEIIASEKPSRAQLFVSTHIPNVLQGLVDIAPDRLRVLRIRRQGSVNRTKELDKGLVQQISRDPLMKYSSVMAGLFHERVIICEADSDCLLYSSLLDIPSVHQGHPRDVLFVHANGKHRMAALAQALSALDVPVDVIADIDILRDETDLKKLVGALGGDWSQAQPLSNSVRSAVEQGNPYLDSPRIREAIQETLDQAPSSGEFPRNLRNQIESTLRKGSRWEFIKSAGTSALPHGQATQQFHELQKFCNEIGMWIVPVGELEGFCPSIGGHGPGWVQQVIEEKDLADDPELAEARDFVSRIWASKLNSV